MKWAKEKIKINEQTYEAIAPIIISASRATDIPAFYSDWFIDRLINKKYIKWKNPFSGSYLYISLSKVRLIVFWTKNPKPLLKHLSTLNENNYNYYFQFTLNDYENEYFEPNVPPLNQRIDTFIELSEKIGKEKVIWRFDPVLITNHITIDQILKRIDNIANKLKHFTDKLVFSFADIKNYKKVTNNLNSFKINYIDFNTDLMNEFAKKISEHNKNWNLTLATCAENIELDAFGIKHNKCIDDDLIIKLFYRDVQLMNFLGVNVQENTIFADNLNITKNKDLKDYGQREACGCIISKDIGEYNTCPHGCIYCYANSHPNIAIINYKKHKLNNNSDSITGI